MTSSGGIISIPSLPGQTGPWVLLGATFIPAQRNSKPLLIKPLFAPTLNFLLPFGTPTRRSWKINLRRSKEDQPVSSAMITVVPAVWQQCLIPFNGTPWKPDEKVARLTMLHKIHHGQTAIPAGKFLQPVTRQSRHHHSKAYQLKSTTKDCYRYSFFPQTIIDWNALPSNIIYIPDNTNFKEAVTNHLRSKSTSN